MRRSLACFVVTLLLAGCASLPAEKQPDLPAVPSAFKETIPHWIAAAPAEAQARGAWWMVFRDPVLNELVERAGNSNTSIQLAATRLAQARVLVRSADANRALQLSLNTTASRQGGPLINAAGADGTLVSAAANLSYEVDLFGRLSKTSNAAVLDAQARAALLQSTRLLVQADVAQTYFGLRALDAERALLRATLADYRDMLRLTERRFKAGYASELDIERLRIDVASNESDALALDQRRAALEHALALLVGEVASVFRLDEAEWSMPLPVIPAGIPSTVLTRRPDVSAAQLSLQAARARVGAAKLAWFPNLTLTASGGYASPDLGDLFKLSMRAWGIGSLLALPIFDGGRREAAVQGATIEQEAALISYREQILVAFKDVEDQLSALRLLAEQADAEQRAAHSAQRTAMLTESRRRNGLVSRLDALIARRDELRTRRQTLQVRAAQYRATVGLVRALGGGWDGIAADRGGS
jgi:outer membrane protein, multidrug efflux system